jgi:hypothetical protein
LTISNVSEKIRRQAPAIHWDGPWSTGWKIALSRGSNVAPKISRNLKLISNSGFFVRGCRIRKPNFSRDAMPGAGRR